MRNSLCRWQRIRVDSEAFTDVLQGSFAVEKVMWYIGNA